MNDWFVKHHTLCLTLTWIFTAIALAVAVYLAACKPEMDFLVFAGYIAIPLIPALYCRIMYGRYTEQRKAQKKSK